MKSNSHYNPKTTTLKLLTHMSNNNSLNYQFLTY